MSKLDEIEKKIAEIEHGFEVVHESQKSLVNHITGDVGKNLDFFVKNWNKIKKILDTNNDGIIQLKELANPWFIKIVLVNFIAIIIQIGMTTLITGLTGEGWNWNNIMIGISAVIGPFLVGIITKFIVDDYDGRLRLKDKIIQKHVQKIKELELARIADKNKHEQDIHQLELAVELKKQYIDLYIDGKEKKE
ncbi:MAG: hypothetical protein ACTSWX_09320 [Promethearchaeota archaeon]